MIAAVTIVVSAVDVCLVPHVLDITKNANTKVEKQFQSFQAIVLCVDDVLKYATTMHPITNYGIKEANMIEVKNLTKRFGNQLSFLDSVNLTFEPNSSTIIRQMEQEKPPCLRTILGEYIPTQGDVLIHMEQSFTHREEAWKNIGFRCSQLPPPIKLSAELIHYAVVSSGLSKETISIVPKNWVGLKGQFKQTFSNSQEEWNKTCLLPRFASKSELFFIFDEPTANLDPKGRDILLNFKWVYQQ